MVDFEPGMITSPASSGSGLPGGTNTTSTCGSALSGSRSSKLAMRDSIGTAIFRARFSPPASLSRMTESSDGRSAAAFSHGTTPKQRQPVNFSIARSPSSNSETSPRNLLMR